MEYFSEEHSKLLLSKEWLVKIDTQTSIPYLFKFYASTVDLSCCVLVTDTKTCWAEVMNSKQFARRWRDCNKHDNSHFSDMEEEEAWRTRNIDLLNKGHSIGGIADLAFEVTESSYADFAFELESDHFNWRWETTLTGHRLSAELLSKHLIMPLISVNHMTFSSTDAVCDISESDLEKAIDKVGRTARRTVDTHIKNALSRPRVATTLRRMTAMFNFIPDLPGIITNAEKPDLSIDQKIKQTPERLIHTRSPSPKLTIPNSIDYDVRNADIGIPMIPENSPRRSLLRCDSATESERDDAGPSVPVPARSKDQSPLPSPADSRANGEAAPSSSYSSRQVSPPSQTTVTKSESKDDASDSESSPIRPVKKARAQPSSSGDDSGDERKRKATQIKAGITAKRGARQPIKRGGKRF
ncbi:hypothetical protein SERLA73DRAFT_181268 [Serpula lacrymans var. lacrymans S7.3]|uniref:XLF-like N-terminal domain-containing protein n=2 Tax=Serpula lacrymans var. lacrymans TaxID=341189 RepID=F8PXR9_SERL3|nr:uncharacterized protein SERLADRAFT_467343 [Serpula lacrymans var. lacrymans S7.9]EGN98682.1 hypothetical protein SERLA73DRAFT_181268 [Serpula lacrymans var. lacrymans S7.3]EGO24286.1 hypothetical protein SERLADRAFT_467343 [Serpula lacrymans var. lacrymans S7.9]